MPSGYVGEVVVSGESGECAMVGVGMEGYSDGFCGVEGGAEEVGGRALRGGIRTFYSPINIRFTYGGRKQHTLSTSKTRNNLVRSTDSSLLPLRLPGTSGDRSKR